MAHQECDDGPVMQTGTTMPPPISTGARVGPGSVSHIHTSTKAIAGTPQTRPIA